MDLDSFMVLYSILFGLALGSFVNVCIYRIPIKKSIISPPSTCPNCGQRIKFYDNIPLISYIFLLGKCRHCRNRIPLSYPAIELLVGFMSLALFIRFGLSFKYLQFLLFVSALITISFIDLRHKIIPDVLSLPGIIAGFLVSFLPGHVTWLDSLIGILSGGGSLFLVGFVYKLLTGREGMGGGDVKLLAMIGAWMCWRSLPFIVLISSLTGAVIGVAFILLSGKGLRFRIPFGPFLSLGALLYFFFGSDLTTLYFRLFG
jgi:leader peptidase (prepilin peptidase)/N-methyltransferase